MSPLFRPAVTSLLCGMIVFGQAPAWLHVGTCDGHGHATVGSTTGGSASVCPHGCQHHGATANVTEDTFEARDSGGDHEHDSDTCVLCQSLAIPAGVTWDLTGPVPSQFVSQPIFAVADSFLPANLLSIPQPRGPPTVA